MTRMVFFNSPFQGHVNTALPIAQELIARGTHVDYYLTDRFRQSVEAINAVFHPISVSLSYSGGANDSLSLQIAEESCRVVPFILEDVRARQPDYIVYDVACLWGRLLAQILSVPAIAIYFSYAVNVHTLRMVSRQLNGLTSGKTAGPHVPGQPGSSLESFMKMHRVLDQLRVNYHLPPLGNLFSHAEPLNIVCIPREFQPVSNSFDERFVFIGPSIQKRLEETDFPFALLDERPLLYISLGTIVNDHLLFYRRCLEAFRDQPWQVVLSIGEKVEQEALGSLPANFIVRSHVPQLEILQRTSIFLTHGGMSSVMEALYYNVPLVVFPRTPEHKMTGLRVAEFGLGITIEDEDVTVQTLRDAVTTVFHDVAMRNRVEHMSRLLQNAGGSKLAADAILRFAEK